jgi:di/tricarboxylate transporter
MLHEKDGPAGGGTEIKMVEAIIGPRSGLIGRSIRESGIRRRYGIVVTAVHRRGLNLREGYQDIRLAFGDTLLLEGPAHNLLRLRQEGDFLSLNESEIKAPRRSRVLLATGILAAVVLSAALELLPIASAALAGAVLAILTRCIDLREAYRSIEWNILFLIYGMLGIGRAMESTGGAELMAGAVVASMQALGPIAILAAIYLLASLLTELVTNNAVAILLTPVAISIAASLEVDPRPFIVAIMFGASASFLTPIGYQTNTYVYGAGGYKFGDFLKVGLPLNLLLWIAATLLIPRFWPF